MSGQKTVRQCNTSIALAIKTSSIITLTVPKYEEISVKNLWELVKDSDDLKQYFPDIDEGKIPERDFMMEILWTLKTDVMKQLINESH